MINLESLLVKGRRPTGEEVTGYYSRCEDTHYISAHEAKLVDPEVGHYENFLIPYEVLPGTIEKVGPK